MEITGTYRYTYRRDIKTGDTRFSFLPLEAVKETDKYGNLLCVGKIPLYSKGMPLKLYGEIRTTMSGYSYFYLEKVEEYVEHEALLKQYLIKNFQGISEKRVSAILDYTGSDIFSFALKENAEELLISNVKGTAKIAKELIKELRSTMVIRDIMEKIEPLGGLYEHALFLFARHGNQALKAFLSEPYKEGSYAGMDISLCDRFCKAQGIPYYDQRRAEGYLLDVMQHRISMGDSCVSSDEIIRTATEYIKMSCYEESIPYSCLYSALIKQIEKNGFMTYQADEKLWIYLPKLSEAEDTVAKQVIRLQKASSKTKWKEEMLHKIEEDLQVQYNEGQRDSFRLLESTGIKILTGPPGSGKTMTIKGMMQAFQSMYPDKKIALCASTGRAAQVMSQASGHISQTLHKLLDIRPFGNWDIQSKNENDPIDADFIICDEVSMNGVSIMSLLFRAVKSGAILLLVGDEDQLQSVDPGNVLYDLIHSKKIEVYRLSEVMRQQTGHIYTNALLAKNGNSHFIQDDTFVIKNFESEEQILEHLKENYKKSDTENYIRRQIISITKVGVCGTKNINKLYEQKKNAEEMVYGGFAYHIHDKVILNRTNYRKGYYNGDIGFIKEMQEGYVAIQIDGRSISLEPEEFQDMEPAEAITAHKAQGSEFDEVYFIVSPQYRHMLTKRILYTTMTRAKKKLIVLTCENAIMESVASNKERIRYSNLISKLQEAGEKA